MRDGPTHMSGDGCQLGYLTTPVVVELLYGLLYIKSWGLQEGEKEVLMLLKSKA